MLRGATKISLDAKGRMSIPARYRDEINERSEGRVVCTVDLDHCLLIYPQPDWEDLERRLMRLPGTKPANRRMQRLMVGHASEQQMDSHGRILIPRELREFAGLEKQAMLLGQGTKFELWDESRWNQQVDGYLEDDSAEGELPEELEALLI
jgi:MraZ protein